MQPLFNTLTLTDKHAYLSTLAVDDVLKIGNYVRFEHDAALQAIYVKPIYVKRPYMSRNRRRIKRGLYRICRNYGATVRVRDSLTREGLEEGIYVHIGNLEYRHIDHLPSELISK